MKKLWMLALIPLLLATSCEDKDGKEQSKKAEILLEKAHQARNYQLLMTLADSLETTGELSTADANYWMGYASDRMNRKRMAEFYWKASLEAAANDETEMDIYAKSASRLVNLLTLRGDYQGALDVAMPVASRLEKLKCDSTSDYINLLIYTGCCQAGLGSSVESSADGFERAYKKHLDIIERDNTDEAYKDAIAGLINIAYACISTKDYKEALKWVSNFGELLSQYEQRPGTNGDYIDKQLARFKIYQAMALNGQDRKDEAAKIYDEFQESEFSKTPEGRITANDYLIVANRWEEAAENYRSLDALLSDQKTGYTLDNIENMVLKKYLANLKAGNRDSAIAVSMQLCDVLGKTIAQEKQINAEEQSTIVREVEEMIASQARTTRHHQLGLMGITGLVLLCFIAYALYRRYANQRMKADYEEHIDELVHETETIADESRLKTEDHISRTLQQNMLPKALPKCKGYGFEVSFSPGNAMPTDFYDYQIRNGKLFFCIGGTIGHNVFGAVLTNTAMALFRNAVNTETAPEKIVATINETIALNNEEMRGLTFFVGVLDPITGELDYCNAKFITPLLLTKEVGHLPVDENKAVGESQEWQFTGQRLTLERGTTLFFFTDGLTRAKSPEGKPYGEKRVRGTALQALKMNPAPQAFIQNVRADIQKYTADSKQDYDATMLVIGRL